MSSVASGYYVKFCGMPESDVSTMLMTTAMKAMMIADKGEESAPKVTFIQNNVLAADVQPNYNSCCRSIRTSKQGGENKKN